MSDPVTIAIAAAAAGKATEAMFNISTSAFTKLRDVIREKLTRGASDEQALEKAISEKDGDAALKALASRIAELRKEDSGFDQQLEAIVPSTTIINWNDYRVTTSHTSTITNEGTINAKNVIQADRIENLRLD